MLFSKTSEAREDPSASTSSTAVSSGNSNSSVTSTHSKLVALPPTTRIPSSPRAHAEARAAVLATLSTAGSAQDAVLQLRATDLHHNAASILKQEKALAQHTRSLASEASKWQREADRAAASVKELGDVQNWAEMLERDLCVLEETMRLVEGRDRMESASGGSTWR